MIPVDLIKKPAVSHDQYQHDSDDELNFMQMQMNGGRAHAKNGQKNGRKNNHNRRHKKSSRKKKQNNHDHIYDDDSDFEGGDDDKKQEKQKNEQILKQQSFDKVEIINIAPKRQMSGLSALINTTPTKQNGGRYGGYNSDPN
eukprot:286989_1